ncbi:MAG: endonuclease/exonuclease/phosphatase family protein [Nitrospirales bacterium]
MLDNLLAHYRKYQWHLLILTALAASGCTVLGYFGYYWWLFELASHFRVQYFFILLTCAVLFLGIGEFREAFLVGVFSLVNLFTIMPYNAEVHAVTRAPESDVQIVRALLLNVNTSNKEFSIVREFIAANKADFIVLLEVNTTWLEQLQPVRKAYPFEKSMPSEEYGIALLSRIPFEEASIRMIGDLPSVIAKFNTQGRQFTLIGTHPRSPMGATRAKSRNRQLGELGRFIATHEGPMVLMGDLNLTPWSPFFQNLLVETGLQDSRNGYGIQPTWPSTFPPLWIPIDHILLSSDVVVHNRQVGPYIGSDHYPVVVEFSVTSSVPIPNSQ